MANLDRRGALIMLGAMALPKQALAKNARLAGRTVRLVVEFGAGTPPDLIARLMAPLLATKMGANVIVEPKPGGSGRIAAQTVAKSAPDGTTLLVVTGSQTVISATDSNLTYDFVRDFSHISMIAEYPFCISVASTSKYKTFADLVAQARREPNSVSYASAGAGTTTHLAVEMLSEKLGISLMHVPYTTAGSQALIDVLAGTVDIIVNTPNGAIAQGDRLRVLAVTSKQREPTLLDAPSVSEIVPDFDVTTWMALSAPANMPADLVAELNDAAREAVLAPSVDERIRSLGFTPVANSPEQMRDRILSDIRKWKPYGKLLK
jgi:tripartite-type tricarboxylate transporter receptor subunit TctC